MKLPETLYFMRAGWWAAHVFFVLLFLAGGAAFGIHLAVGHGVGAHHHGAGHEHAAHSAAHEHAAHGDAHGSDDPTGLRPVMREMLVSVVAAQAALDRGDAHGAQPHVQAIATACDSHGAEEERAPDPALVGPRFAELDHQLHSGAAELARAATAGELEPMRRGFGTVVSTCVSCHEQAPSARGVDLGRLTAPFPTH